MAEVVLENICKTYGNNFHAIQDLNLTIADGEFLILVGPSGCGKSTALRMIAGLEETTSGHLYIGGRDVVDMAPKDRDIAMVFQSYALYPHMTVSQNIAFSMRLAGKSKAERTARVAEIANILQLTDLLDSKPANLSGGQRQRVAMGRAMVREPAAFLMDEPLSNLDAKLRVKMRAEIAGLQRQLGVTTIYVTHDQTEAMTMGDRVAVMKGGILQQVDVPKRLYDEPVNAFVAGFIGSPSMNLLEADLDAGVLKTPGFELRLTESLLSRLPLLERYNGKKVVFGIRPEDLHDSRREAARDHQIIPAAVVNVEELGSERVVHLRLNAIQVDSGDPDAVADLSGLANAVARFDPGSEVRAGAQVDVAVDCTKLHFFDPETHVVIR
ncbi:ABC transporter ATP-binding protein [uncultured Hoeflea sp.]|uniref:ABC transporter ATP-binding protein n=1 Tax=uncultured Hoeflea sp. TaxID=538666 RepID=UPI0030DB8261|tara:strand:- start:938 stop:2086 length:1149 start_codon:yes stop_codon:yes gene_type:complete